MTKLEKNIRRVHKEGILDKIFSAIEKQVKKMSDRDFEKVKKQYDKDYQRLLNKYRNESKFWRKK